MRAELRAVTTALAGVEGGAPDTHTRRAFEAVRDSGPIEEVDGRMFTHLEGRLGVAYEREAWQIRLQAFQARRPSEQATQAARERVLREGGVSHQHAQDLGYESAGDLTGQC